MAPTPVSGSPVLLVSVVDVLALAQVGLVIVFLSRVTAALRANALPCRVALVLSPIDVRAIIVPMKLELVPSVAELVTCQNTLQA